MKMRVYVCIVNCGSILFWCSGVWRNTSDAHAKNDADSVLLFRTNAIPHEMTSLGHTPILIIIESQLQAFRRFPSSKL